MSVLDEVKSLMQTQGFIPKVDGLSMMAMDVALVSTGWVYTVDLAALDVGVIQPGQIGAARLTGIYAKCQEYFQMWQPNWLVIEGLGDKGQWESSQVSEAMGVVKAAWCQYRDPLSIVYVHPTRLPCLLGSRKVVKKARIDWLQTRLPSYMQLVEKYNQRGKEDITDAFLMTLLGLYARSYKLNNVNLTPTLQKILLEKMALVQQFYSAHGEEQG